MSRTFEGIENGKKLYYYPKDTEARVVFANEVVITCEIEGEKKEILKFDYEGVLLGEKKPTLFWVKPKIEIPKSPTQVLEELFKGLKATSLVKNRQQQGYRICHNENRYYVVLDAFPAFGTIKFHDFKEVKAVTEILNEIGYKTEAFKKMFNEIFMGGTL